MEYDTEDIQQTFADAVLENNIDLVKSILTRENSNLNINALTDLGYPILHQAIADDSVEIVKLLIEKGARLNFVDERGKSALHVAAGCSSLAMLNVLLEKNMDCNKLDINKRTPLHYVVSCSEQGDEEIFEMINALLRHGADINVFDSSKLSPLNLSIVTKRSNVSRHLIDMGVDVNDSEQYNAIFIAIYSSEISTIKYLIDRGARVDIVRDENQSTISTAIIHIVNKEHRLKVVKWLLEAGANANHHFTDGLTVLHLALMQNDINVFHLLIEHGASIFARNLRNHSPLFTAVTYRFYEGVKALLKMGAEVNDCDINGFSIFSSAVFHNNTDEMLKLLVDYGADPKHRLEMIIAASEGHLRIIKFLVSCGAIIDNQEKYWLCTKAIKNLNIDIIQYFLDVDVDLNYMSEKMTLLHRAFNMCKNENSNENDNAVLRTPAKLLIKYIAIRVARDLDVHEMNFQLIHSKPWSIEHYEACQSELTLMKSMKIYEDESNRTYFHLLTKRHSALVNCLRNENVRSVLKNQEYKNSFKIYSSILEEKHLWGVKRLEKLNEFEAIVGEVLGSVFPDNVIQRICEYLKNDDFDKK